MEEDVICADGNIDVTGPVAIDDFTGILRPGMRLQFWRHTSSGGKKDWSQIYRITSFDHFQGSDYINLVRDKSGSSSSFRMRCTRKNLDHARVIRPADDDPAGWSLFQWKRRIPPDRVMGFGDMLTGEIWSSNAPMVRFVYTCTGPGTRDLRGIMKFPTRVLWTDDFSGYIQAGGTLNVRGSNSVRIFTGPSDVRRGEMMHESMAEAVNTWVTKEREALAAGGMGGMTGSLLTDLDLLANFPPSTVRTSPCGRCSHPAHGNLCTGRSPSGDYSCPCGEVRRSPQGKVRIVGTYVDRYGERRPSDCTWDLRQRKTGAPLPVSYTEAPPRPLTLFGVRDIYWPGRGDVDL